MWPGKIMSCDESSRQKFYAFGYRLILVVLNVIFSVRVHVHTQINNSPVVLRCLLSWQCPVNKPVITPICGFFKDNRRCVLVFCRTGNRLFSLSVWSNRAHASLRASYAKSDPLRNRLKWIAGNGLPTDESALQPLTYQRICFFIYSRMSWHPLMLG